MGKRKIIICILLPVIAVCTLFLAIANYPLCIYVVNVSKDERNATMEIMGRVRLEWNILPGAGCRTRLWRYPEGGGVITDDRGFSCDDFYLSDPLVDCDILILIMDGGIEAMCIK